MFVLYRFLFCRHFNCKNVDFAVVDFVVSLNIFYIVM